MLHAIQSSQALQSIFNVPQDQAINRQDRSNACHVLGVGFTGGRVTFEPGARTAWHSHPLGQTLIVTAGSGLIQQWDGQIEEIRQGDVVWIPPGVTHWHGAAPGSAMTHIAIQENLEGKTADWKDHVSDEQYRKIR